MTWRDQARPIIGRVIRANAGRPEREIRRALRAAYPWGVRANHPYRIWCDEVNYQLGAKKAAANKPRATTASDPRQPELF